MSRKQVYFALFVIGTVVPYVSFVPWLIDHGFDVSRMVEELFANRISAFFGLDVVISTIVFWVFVSLEGPRVGLKSPVGAGRRKPDGRRLVGLTAVSLYAGIRLERRLRHLRHPRHFRHPRHLEWVDW